MWEKPDSFVFAFARACSLSFVRWRPLTPSFVRSFIRTLMRSFFLSFVRVCTPWLVSWVVRGFVGSLVRWFAGSLVRLLVRSFVGLFVRSVSVSVGRSSVHSLISSEN